VDLSLHSHHGASATQRDIKDHNAVFFHHGQRPPVSPARLDDLGLERLPAGRFVQDISILSGVLLRVTRYEIGLFTFIF
jgi:hypothetical protein